MANTNLDYWDVDGVSLQTYAFNIETIGGDRLAPPPLIGENILIPGASRELWVPKEVGSRVITLAMWVIGADEDGFAPTSGSAAAEFDKNFRKLRQLLWNPYRQVTLTKRFYVDGVLKTASAKAQYVGGLNPTMNGRARASFSVDLELNDPFFYSPELTVNLANGSNTVNVQGDARTSAIKLNIAGARTNPKVRNSTLDVDVEHLSSLPTGDQIDIDVQKFTSITNPASGSDFNSVGAIRHTGGKYWLLLQPGANTVVVSSTAGTGAVTLKYREAWL